MSDDPKGQSPDPQATEFPGRPWGELRDSGLLWLINTSVFHPRGYALAIHMDDNDICTGWSILGNGQELFVFDGSEATTSILDALFTKVRETLP